MPEGLNPSGTGPQPSDRRSKEELSGHSGQSPKVYAKVLSPQILSGVAYESSDGGIGEIDVVCRRVRIHVDDDGSFTEKFGARASLKRREEYLGLHFPAAHGFKKLEGWRDVTQDVD